MEKIIKYKTADGSEFDNQDLAHRHEIRLETEVKLKEILASAAKKPSPSDAFTWLRLLTTHATEVRDALNEYNRRMPRAKGQEQEQVNA